jgi:hypothetical protein
MVTNSGTVLVAGFFCEGGCQAIGKTNYTKWFRRHNKKLLLDNGPKRGYSRISPGVSREMLRRVLCGQKGKSVECIGRGAGAKWQKKG